MCMVITMHRQVSECCIKGCNNKHRSLGFCDVHYSQWRRYGHPLSRELKYVRHGHRQAKSDTKEYRVWHGMKKRCNCETDPNYHRYGARGIKVCDAWDQSFKVFIDDMGPCPNKYSIERIDNNGNYEPSNCKWATAQEQGQNKRDVYLTKDIVIDMRVKHQKGFTVKQIADSYSFPYNTTYMAVTKRSWKWVNG